MEKATTCVSAFYKGIFLQGQLFINGLSAAESFVTAESFHFIVSLAIPLQFCGVLKILLLKLLFF